MSCSHPTRTVKGEKAMVSLVTGSDPELRAEMIEVYRADHPNGLATDDEIIDLYVRLILSFPLHCPICEPPQET